MADRAIVLRVDDFAQAADHAAIVEAGIVSQPPRIESILRAERRVEERRAQIDADDAPVAADGLQHVVGEFGLMAAVKGADANMRHADSEGAPIISGASNARPEVVKGRRLKPPHADALNPSGAHRPRPEPE